MTNLLADARGYTGTSMAVLSGEKAAEGAQSMMMGCSSAS
jgi:hypothetical protein